MKNEQITAAIAKITSTQTKIRKKDILKITSIRDNPITKHLLKKFTINGTFEFEKLLDALREFALNDQLSPKIKLLFDLYDCDNDGVISRCDLFNVIKMFSDESLCDSNIQNVVDRCFLDLECNEITFKNFKTFIENSNPNLKVFMRCSKS
ncbi:hypothetical protein VCUG_00861 [Vavraia culicis subsp. floridensis]|uniref:Calcineurin subunit B n=1 Tax=Vavraia culicis (isolate floridensis) TaxID=948595 RepID=L2GX31_VAVCU|nr:uncharacterized protein VCUG_00861 [Vavraia culicis subsp. floridensis]ELA47660.1 hypothetical protein VCUG_00861 [Vavraia culicis subsp. floridensis]